MRKYRDEKIADALRYANAKAAIIDIKNDYCIYPTKVMGSGIDMEDSLRSRQIAALKQILNLNQAVSVSLAVEPVWKILILDRYGKDIISPLINIKELRELGVTLHLLLDSHREALLDVPAIYFVSPTDENIKIISNDLIKGMYDSFYLNMIYPLTRPRLETLATAAVQGDTMQCVQKVTDQFLNFVCLEDDLFVLRRYNDSSPISFYAINEPSVTPKSMELLIDTIVDGLFSICTILGVVPTIKCPKGNAAEQVATRLDQKLRDNFRDARNNLFTQDGIRANRLNIYRPVLIIADRGIDLVTMLQHTWTYQALAHDVLDLDLNRVIIKDKSGKKKEYDMNVNDKLWMDHKSSAFPLVAEAIQEDVEKYKSKEDEIKCLKHAMGMDDVEIDEGMSLLSDTTAKLTSAVGSLPELLEKKRLIDLHTTVATTILDLIKQRKLDVLFEAEEKIIAGQSGETNVLDLMRRCTDPEDALRLMLINYLRSGTINETEITQQLNHLNEVGIDSSAASFAKQLRSISTMNRTTNDYTGGGINTESMFANLLSTGSQFLMEGVKNLVLKKHNLPLTKMIDFLLTGGSHGFSRSDDDFRYFDPKVMHSSSRDSQRVRSNTNTQDVIVFVVGGGNYVEYQNVMDYGRSKGIPRMRYGCTELVNPRQFLDQMTRVGRQVV